MNKRNCLSMEKQEINFIQSKINIIRKLNPQEVQKDLEVHED